MSGIKKIDFTQVKILDIKGDPIDMWEAKLHETIGNAVYNEATTIPLAEISKKIYAGEVVELRENEVTEIKQIIEKSFIPLVKRQVIDFIDNAQ